MLELADRLLDEAATDCGYEFIGRFSQPFGLLVIADLLGVPEDDHRQFVHRLASQNPGAIEATRRGEYAGANSLEWLEEWFSGYVEDRRRAPRQDVLTSLATTRFPSGELPLGTRRYPRSNVPFYCRPGDDSPAARFGDPAPRRGPGPSGAATVGAGADPRFRRGGPPLETPAKSIHRLVTKTTTLSGVELKAGTTLLLLAGAANRDPRRFDDPQRLDIDRPNLREHVAFGRGIRSSVGRRPWPGSSPGSLSNVSWPVWATYGSRRITTGRRAHAGCTGHPHTSSGAWSTCT